MSYSPLALLANRDEGRDILVSVSLGRERNIISSWLGNEYSVAFSMSIVSALRAENILYFVVIHEYTEWAFVILASVLNTCVNLLTHILSCDIKNTTLFHLLVQNHGCIESK